MKCMASIVVEGAGDAPAGPWLAQCTRRAGHAGPHVDGPADWTWRRPWARPRISHVALRGRLPGADELDVNRPGPGAWTGFEGRAGVQPGAPLGVEAPPPAIQPSGGFRRGFLMAEGKRYTRAEKNSYSRDWKLRRESVRVHTRRYAPQRLRLQADWADADAEEANRYGDTVRAAQRRQAAERLRRVADQIESSPGGRGAE